jgi:putative ABC transport system permease protein
MAVAAMHRERDARQSGWRPNAPRQTFTGEGAELPETAPGMVRRLAGVEGAAATKLLDQTVRRTDHIDEAETGGIAVMASDTTLARTLEARLRTGRFLNDPTAR